MVIVPRGPGWLRGREAECQRLRELISTARAGRSAVLVIQGEAGIGKSALLDYLHEEASDCRVLRAAGIESEMELSFAGLHQLCAPLLDGVDALPAPQAAALATAFGLAPGAPPDRFMIGLAVLSLLSERTEEQVLVCLVDDAQWLDQTSVETLAFVARRLLAERIVFVFASRPVEDERIWNRLPQLTLSGLAAPDADELLASAVPARLDPRVRRRILAESRGNPLALIELGRWSSPAELTFGIEVPLVGSVADRIEERFRFELERLPESTQRLLLLAAAEPLGDVGLLWQAAAALGVGMDVAEPAEAVGLVEIRSTVRFRHPLVRSAVYRMAVPSDRQAVHRALAEATDPERDPDRRAWHLAQAASEPDEAVAAELETSAGRALAHGGLAAAAAFLERAAMLSPDERTRTERRLSAAETALAAGMLEDVQHLVALLDRSPLDDLQRARCEVLRAQIAFASNRGGDAVFLLLAAAQRLEPLLPSLARDTYVAALEAALFVGRLAPAPGVGAVARAARQAPPVHPPRRSDLLMESVAILLDDGLAEAAPVMRRAYEAFLTETVPVEEALRFYVLAGVAANNLWDLAAWTTLIGRLLQLARQSGALVTLQLALTADAYVRLFNGDLVTAAAHLDEAKVLAEVSGVPVHPYCEIAMVAFRGDLAAAATLVAPAQQDAVDRGEGLVVCFATWSQALVCIANGMYDVALNHLRELLFDPAEGQLKVEAYELGPNAWALPDLVEAAVRCGDLATASAGMGLLSEVAAISGTDWVLGVAARSQAQLSGNEQAEDLYLEAIERLGRGGVRVEHARALLLYGEWLRRVGRRSEARDALRRAYDSLAGMGVRAFADRARRELSAAGEAVAGPAAQPSHDLLTAQELNIARLAAAGRTNPEIGAELYLSRHTVEWHLKKVFAKLKVNSRHQLRDALGTSVA